MEKISGDISLIRASELSKKIGLSTTTIWRLEKAGKFPKRKKVGDHITVWSVAEVNKWISDVLSSNNT